MNLYMYINSLILVLASYFPRDGQNSLTTVKSQACQKQIQMGAVHQMYGMTFSHNVICA